MVAWPPRVGPPRSRNASISFTTWRTSCGSSLGGGAISAAGLPRRVIRNLSPLGYTVEYFRKMGPGFIETMVVISAPFDLSSRPVWHYLCSQARESSVGPVEAWRVVRLTASCRLTWPSRLFCQVGEFESSKSAMNTLALEFRALIIIFRSTGPVISTGRSSKPRGRGPLSTLPRAPRPFRAARAHPVRPARTSRPIRTTLG